MKEPELILLMMVAAVCLALLGFHTFRAARLRRRLRGAYFDLCQPLLADSQIQEAPTGFPRLSGHYKGVPCNIQAAPDTLTFRKLPALWVLITLPCPLPVRASFDLMVRPTGVETFSGFHRLPEQIAIPNGFPGDCAIRTDDSDHLLPEYVIRPYLALFNNPRIKELLISPKGLRIVFLAEEADRSRYLIFRDAEMGRTPVDPQQIAPLLERLLALKTDIEGLSPDQLTRQAA